MAIYALLVGINEYRNSNINPLQGCENDVELFASTLQARFDVAPDNIIKLKSGRNGIAATRQNIIDNFQQHLIGKSTKQDVAIFYFSGHGAQSQTHEIFHDMEPDGLDESLVCHDSRHEDIPDLRDKELRFLLQELEKKAGHIAVFLDCCHGGHGTRFLDEDMQQIRMAKPDTSTYPLEKYLFSPSLPQPPSPDAAKALLSKPVKHILLAGCRDYQLSRERLQGDSNKRQFHGLFTYALCTTLNTLQYPVSYRELGTRIHAQVQRLQLSQTPQIEAIGGADDREALLGGEIQPSKLLVFARNNVWMVNVGAIHGFNPKDEIALFVGDISEDFSQAPKARIQTLDAFESTLEILDGATLDTNIAYNGVVTRRHFTKTAISFIGDGLDLQETQALLAADNSAADPGRFLELNEDDARYTLHAEEGTYYVTQPDDPRPLFEKQQLLDGALNQLAIMARWWQKLELDNPECRLPTDAIEIVIEHDEQQQVSEDVSLRYQLQDDGLWKQPAFKLTLRLKDDYPGTLYCALLYFDGSTGSIIGSPLVTTTLLTHQQSAIEGRAKAVSYVPAYEGNPIPVAIKDELHQQGVTKIQDFLKIIVSEKEFDASLLEQGGNELYSPPKNMRSALDSTLQQFMDDLQHRSLDLQPKAGKATDWYAKTISLTIIRPQDVQEIQPDRSITLTSNSETDIRVEPHSAFHGTVRLINAYDENSRTTKVEEPAIFANRDSMIDFSKGTNTDLGLDAIEIFIDSGSKGTADTAQQVSSDNPLQFSLKGTLAEGEHIIPYTYDEESGLFLPLGQAHNGADGRTWIQVEHLPATASRSSPDTRSLGRSLKIYFRKLVYRDLLKLDEEIHVLGTPRFAPNDPARVDSYLTDPQAIMALVADAQKILLVIHGIIGCTDSMAGFINIPHTDGGQYLRDEYDLVLTFDYENLNTRIQDIARALKERLQAVGITPESSKQLDIVAHSMGGLVSRHFIEREGGAGIVRKLVMVGTPNGGSPYATLKEGAYPVLKTWAYSNLAVALNGLTNAFVGGAAIAGLMKLLDSIDNTLDQMAPDSDFLHELFHSPQPQTRYALIAGDTDSLLITVGDNPNRMARLGQYLKQRLKVEAYEWLTEKLFREHNDIAVSHGSMTHFNPDWNAEVAVQTVKCDHLSYFQDRATIQQIAKQLRT